jgi:hypothetical protein
MMIRRRLAPAVVLVLALAVPLTGCSSKLRWTAKQMCEAHGGTYNAQSQSCSYVAMQRTAKQNCEAHGGVYWPQEQYCEVEAGR